MGKVLHFRFEEKLAREIEFIGSTPRWETITGKLPAFLSRVIYRVRHGKRWAVLEQIIDDPVSGLAFEFFVSTEGHPRLRIFGNLPFGNREFIFDRQGKEAGAGTALTGLCRRD